MLWRMGVWGAGWYDGRDVGMIVGGRKPVEESGRRRYCVKPLGVAALTSGFSCVVPPRRGARWRGWYISRLRDSCVSMITLIKSMSDRMRSSRPAKNMATTSCRFRRHRPRLGSRPCTIIHERYTAGFIKRRLGVDWLGVWDRVTKAARRSRNVAIMAGRRQMAQR